MDNNFENNKDAINNNTINSKFPNAINIYFINKTNHWLWFDNEISKKAILTSIKLQMK